MLDRVANKDGVGALLTDAHALVIEEREGEEEEVD